MRHFADLALHQDPEASAKKERFGDEGEARENREGMWEKGMADENRKNRNWKSGWRGERMLGRRGRQLKEENSVKRQKRQKLR